MRGPDAIVACFLLVTSNGLELLSAHFIVLCWSTLHLSQKNVGRCVSLAISLAATSLAAMGLTTIGLAIMGLATINLAAMGLATMSLAAISLATMGLATISLAAIGLAAIGLPTIVETPIWTPTIFCSTQPPIFNSNLQ